MENMYSTSCLRHSNSHRNTFNSVLIRMEWYISRLELYMYLSEFDFATVRWPMFKEKSSSNREWCVYTMKSMLGAGSRLCDGHRILCARVRGKRDLHSNFGCFHILRQFALWLYTMAVPFSFFLIYIFPAFRRKWDLSPRCHLIIWHSTLLFPFISSHDGRRFAFLPIENRKIREIVSFSEIEKLNPSFAGFDGVLVRAIRWVYFIGPHENTII